MTVELNLKGFDKDTYTKEIVKQKNANKDYIISIFKSSRNSYQEFKIEFEKLRDKQNEKEIIEYISSDEIEIFFKAYSMKDHFNKDIIAKYNLRQQELSKTEWFIDKLKKLLELN